MQKFTVFTVILSVVIVVVVADLMVNNYLPGLKEASISDIASSTLPLPKNIDVSKAMETNVVGSDQIATDNTDSANVSDPESYNLGFDLNNSTGTATVSDNAENTDSIDNLTLSETTNDIENSGGLVSRVPKAQPDTGTTVINSGTTQPVNSIAADESDPVLKGLISDNTDQAATTDSSPATAANTTSTSPATDFESNNFVASSKSVLLRDEQIVSAGFVDASLVEEKYDGSLYKTIFTDDLYDVTVDKMVVKTKDAMLAKIYMIKIGPNSSLDEVYQVLKVRAAEGLNAEVNETNDFGDGSFYMNDSQRSTTAFLTVKIGSMIYGFSYPKEYHAQIKNLIQLLMWEKK